MAFSDNLQYLRKRDKVTQEELADRLGVSRQSVSKWETGEAYPETEKILALCDNFGISMDQLMRGDVSDPSRKGAGCGNGEEAASVGDDDKAVGAVGAAESARGARLSRAGGIVNAAVIACTAIVYICLGACAGLWHPGWLAFIAAAALVFFFDKVFCTDGEGMRPLAARVLDGLSAMMMALSTFVYLLVSILWGVWHPAWVVFIIGGVLMAAFGALSAVAAGRGKGD